MSENTHVCPVCGEYVFEEPGLYDICPICGWEADPVQYEDYNYRGGANSESVNEARTRFFER